MLYTQVTKTWMACLEGFSRPVAKPDAYVNDRCPHRILQAGVGFGGLGLGSVLRDR